MDISDIRNMSDNELRRFLNNVSQRNCQVCCKCGKATIKENRIGLYVFRYENRKLCTLCNDCYVNLLDYLEISDID